MMRRQPVVKTPSKLASSICTALRPYATAHQAATEGQLIPNTRTSSGLNTAKTAHNTAACLAMDNIHPRSSSPLTQRGRCLRNNTSAASI